MDRMSKTHEQLLPGTENVPDIVYALDGKGAFVSLNKAAEDILGYSRAELIGVSALQFIHPDDQAEMKAGLEEAMSKQDQEVRRFEFRMLAKGGEVKFFEVNRRLIFEHGQFVRNEGIARDVTERKQLEDNLLLYKEIVTNTQDAVVILDANRNYIEQNLAHREMLGYTDEELAGHTPALHTDQETFERVGKQIWGKGSFRGEIRSQTKVGRWIDIELLAFPVKNDNGEVLCHVGFARDISERKRTELRGGVMQRVREEVWKMVDADDIANVLAAIGEGLEQLAIEYLECGINVIDTTVEPPVVKSRSMSRQGQWLVSDSEKGVGELTKMWQSQECSCRDDLGAEDPFEKSHHVDVRSVVDVPFSDGTLRLTSDKPNAYSEQVLEVLKELAAVLSEGFRRMGDLQQISDAHTQLLQSEKMAALGNLVAGIAHEINTPVGAIHSMHDTLVRAVGKLKSTIERDFPKDCKEHMGLQGVLKIIEDSNRVIETGTSRVTTIVRSLRNFARLDHDHLTEVDIHDGLNDTLMLVHHDIKNRIEVVKEYAELPAIACYPSRLNQVFLNILNNAQQAIDGKGTIRVATFLRDGEACVSISDTGSGIGPESLAKIFESGFTTKGAATGTGLGLAICQQIMADHKGRIDVESKVGEGTTFTVVLPVGLQETF